MCAALGDEEEVKKEVAEKDEFSWPWSKDKDKDKDKVGALYVHILTTMLMQFIQTFASTEKQNLASVFCGSSLLLLW